MLRDYDLHTLEATGAKPMRRCRRTALNATSGSPRPRSQPRSQTSFFAENVALFSIIFGSSTLWSRHRLLSVLTVLAQTSTRRLRHRPRCLAPQAFCGGFGLSRSSSSGAACQTIHAVRCASGRRAIPTITSKRPRSEQIVTLRLHMETLKAASFSPPRPNERPRDHGQSSRCASGAA